MPATNSQEVSSQNVSQTLRQLENQDSQMLKDNISQIDAAHDDNDASDNELEMMVAVKEEPAPVGTSTRRTRNTHMSDEQAILAALFDDSSEEEEDDGSSDFVVGSAKFDRDDDDDLDGVSEKDDSMGDGDDYEESEEIKKKKRTRSSKDGKGKNSKAAAKKGTKERGDKVSKPTPKRKSLPKMKPSTPKPAQNKLGGSEKKSAIIPKPLLTKKTIAADDSEDSIPEKMDKVEKKEVKPKKATKLEDDDDSIEADESQHEHSISDTPHTPSRPAKTLVAGPRPGLGVKVGPKLGGKPLAKPFTSPSKSIGLSGTSSPSKGALGGAPMRRMGLGKAGIKNGI